MALMEAWTGDVVRQGHEAEIDRETVLAFWRLGRVLERNEPRDREVFTLGRCIGGTTGVPSMLVAYGESDDPSSFAMSKLMFGGDQPMHDAYWQTLEDPVVFRLAREVFRRMDNLRESGKGAGEGGALVFDVSGAQARLAGIRFADLR